MQYFNKNGQGYFLPRRFPFIIFPAGAQGESAPAVPRLKESGFASFTVWREETLENHKGMCYNIRKKRKRGIL